MIGNLGASAIVDAAKGRTPVRDPLADELPRLADLGIDAVEDYVGWNVVEPREGAPDFSHHLAHRDAAARLGLGYVVYPWVHALPAWLVSDSTGPRFEPFRCLEHGQPTIHPSIFAPSTLELFERCYSLLARGLGADLEALTIALPCDYGEVGYPTGMGAWVLGAEEEGAHVHVHDGFWCGDEFAARGFRDRVLARFGSLAAVNAIFGTQFLREDEVGPIGPEAAGPNRTTDRYAIELIEWYRDALLAFVRSAVAIARSRFPRARLAIKCGYAGERACFGQDYARLVPLARELGLTLWSTHGTLPVLFHKRIQTLCRVHSVPLFTEAPTERTREQVRDRLFEDAADGVQGFFEFHDTFAGFEADFLAHRELLRGEAPEVRLALLFDSTGQSVEPMRSLPPRLLAISDPLRDLADYEVLDEETIARTDALARFAVLLVPDPGPISAATLAAIERFAIAGGVVVMPAAPALRAIGGHAIAFADMDRTAAAAPFERGALAIRSAADPFTLRFGHGDDEWLLFGASDGIERAAPYFDPPRHDRARWLSGRAGFRVPRPDDRDGVLEVVLFADPRALARPVAVTVDGVAAARVTVPGPHVLELPIAARSATGREHAEIGFDGEAFRPSDDGSHDSRSLFLLLHEARMGDGGATPRLHASVRPDAVLDSGRFHRTGKGGVVFGPANDLPTLAACAVVALSSRSRFVEGAADIDVPAHDTPGVRIARFPGRALLYNRSDRESEGVARIGPHVVNGVLRAREIREIR